MFVKLRSNMIAELVWKLFKCCRINSIICKWFHQSGYLWKMQRTNIWVLSENRYLQSWPRILEHSESRFVPKQVQETTASLYKFVQATIASINHFSDGELFWISYRTSERNRILLWTSIRRHHVTKFCRRNVKSSVTDYQAWHSVTKYTAANNWWFQYCWHFVNTL